MKLTDIFREVTPMVDPNSGREVVRKALAAGGGKRFNLAKLSRDLEISISTLENYALANANVAPEVLQKLVDYLWSSHLRYDVANDRIVPVSKAAPVSIGTPRPFDLNDIPEQYRFKPDARSGPGRAIRGGLSQPKPPSWMKWVR